MGVPMLDTLKASEDLQAAGMPREQANALIKAINEGLRDTVVTKADLQEFAAGRSQQISSLDSKISSLDANSSKAFSSLDSKISQIKTSIIMWIAGLLVAQTAIIATMLALKL